MRKIYLLFFSLLSLLAVTQNAFGQTTVTIPAANTNTGGARFPLGTWFGFERSAMIYTPAQVGGAGFITKVAFYVNAVSSPGQAPNVRVYLKTRTNLFTAATTYATETTGATLVYGPTTILPASLVANQWITLDLLAPYYYAGTENLEVIVETNQGTGGNETSSGKSFRYSTAASSMQTWTADNNAPTGTGTVGGNRPNIQLTMLPPPPCVPGSLDGGTISGPAGACPGTNNVVLTGAGGSIGTGLSYKWQTSATGAAPWTDISGATSAGGVTTTQTTATYYRRVTICSGTEAYSNVLNIVMNGPTQCYCIPTFLSGSEPITLVNFAGINNTSSAALSSPNYENFTALTPAAIFKGQAHPITIKGNTDGSFTSYIAAYFDWNQDGDFDDAGEAYYLGTIASSTGTDAVQLVASITPPASALDGNTRMRITKKFGTSGQAVSVAAAPPCNTAGFGQAEDYMVNVSTPLCALPSNLTATSPIPVGAILNWTAASPAPGATGGYEWAVTSTNTSATTNVVSSGTTPDNVTTTANAAGLTANTTYYAWVRTHCGGGVYSPWTGPVQFRSACDPTTLPYVQKFDAITPPAYPDCFTVQNVNGGLTWQTWTTSSGLAANSQPNSIRCTVDASGPADDWFFLPAFNLTGGTPYYLSFAYKGSDVGFITRMEVKYGNAPNAAAMTNTLFTNNNITSSLNDPWAFQTSPFTPAASGIYYIGFHCTTPASQGWLYVDDIGVELCPTPTNVNAVGITPTSAVVNFTGSASNYIVEYGPVGFVPGTGATAGGGTIIPTTSSPVIISTGLSAATNYDVYVRALCGPTPSNNAKGTLTTLCNATNIIYTQNMETATPALGMPTCTSRQDVNGNSGAYDPGDGFFTPPSGGGGWESYTGTTQTYVSATKSIVYRYDASNLNRGADDWFYLQGLNLTAGTSYRLKFFYKASDGPDYFEKMQVTYGAAAYAPAQTNVLWTNNNIVTNINSPFDSVVVDFSPAATGVYYIGFHAMSDADNAFIYLDDVSVKLAPKVDVGVTAVPLPNLTCPTDGVFLQATIRNFNTTPQNFATYPVTVRADVTGAVTGTASATINTGTLAPGASTTIFLSPAINFNVGGTYNIRAYTSSPDDPELANDTLRTTVNVNPFPVTPVVTPAAPAICIGSTVQLSTQYTPPPAPVTTTVASGTISVTIPDNGPAGSNHTLAVSGIPAGMSILSMTVTANVAHIWMSDVVINLQAPNGKILNLINSKGGSGANLTNTVFSSTSTNAIPATGAPYTGTYRPDAAIGVGPTAYVSNATSFTDLFSVANGNWTLAMRDVEALITGRLTSWTINITYGTVNPTVTWAPVTGLFTDAAATVPYTAGTNALSVYAKPTGTTTYTVTATGAGPCTRTANVTVTVNPLPTVTIGSLPDTVCISDQIVPLSGTPAGGVWSGIGVSGNNFIPPATAVGTYTLRYTYNNQFNCSASATRSIAVKDCPERYNQLRDDAVILWPNPSNGQFNIRINSVLYDWLSVRVYTATGELVGRKDLSGLTFGRVIPFDYSHLAGGVYFVQFYYKNGDRATDKTFKIIVGHN